MKKILFTLILVITIFQFGCHSIDNNKLSVIDFITVFDQNIVIDKPNNVDTFAIKVVDFEKVRMFVVPFHNTRQVTTLLSNGDVEEGAVTYDTTFVYCMYKNGDKFGLRYDSLNAVTSQKFPVDSLLNRINLGEKHLNADSKVNGELVNSIRNIKTNDLIQEKYVSKKDGVIDSTYRYFDVAMKNIGFTISPLIDEKYQSKLIKIVYIKMLAKGNIRNFYSSEFKRGKLKDSIPILNLIKRFNIDKKKRL